MARKPSFREIKKQRTKQRFIEVARELFVAKGFEGTTVDEIAEATGLSRRTFFRYFKTKESVVFPDHERRISLFRELLEHYAKDLPPVTATKEALLDLARDYMIHKEPLLDEFKIVTSTPVLKAKDIELDMEYESAIAETLIAKTDGSKEARYRSTVLSAALFGSVRATMLMWFANGCQEDLFALGDITLEMFGDDFNRIVIEGK